MARRILNYALFMLVPICASGAVPGGQPGMHLAKSAAPPTARMAAAVAGLQTPPAFLARHITASARTLPTPVTGGSSLFQLMQGKYLPLSPTVPAAAVTWDEISGVPKVIRLVSTPAANAPSTLAIANPVIAAQDFLTANRSLLRIENPAAEFSLLRTTKDNDGTTHLRYQQKYAGIEVWASDIYVHAGSDGRVSLFNGTYHPTPVGLNTTAAIPSSQAVNAVQHDLAARKDVPSIPASLQHILGSTVPAVRQVIWYDNAQFPHLAWFVEQRTNLDKDWYYFVDAQTGVILHSYNNVESDGPTTGSGTDLNGAQRNFGTYQTSSEYFMVDASQPMFNSTASQIPQNPIGAIVGLDLRGNDLSAQSTIYFVASNNNTWTDASAVSSQYNASVVYNFYRTVFGRNSINDSGMTIYSIVHVTSNGSPMDNAFWSGQVMCYGDGNTLFKPLAGGFDVAAHEMTHGVTQHSANLVYQNQSGALNESMSDVFASVVDSANWTIGEQVIKDFTAFPTGALRDMSNPHNGGTNGDPAWQPATMAEFVSTTSDNGGVHVNSGIPNFAFYHVANVIGRPSAAAIWYKALTAYLTSAAQFVDARIATESAATQLYGSGSAELTAVKNAWDAVGVTEGTATQPPPSSHIVGTDWILAVNTGASDPNSVYIINPVITSNSDFHPLSTTSVLTRPAVSDTAGVIVFVDQDYRLRAMDANPSAPQEGYLDTNSVWWSAAIGPGLTSLALTSRFIDTSIYYVDFVNKVTKIFKLRVTAYDGTPVATALYSDALSFDPSGRYILFDAYNRTRTAQGDTISFWTINLLDVTTGVMHSVFPPQAEGIDLGNPSFSRTNPNRFVFDYWDEKNLVGNIMGADFFTGKAGVLVSGVPDVGYPTLSADGLAIAYHTLQYPSGVEHHALQQIAIDANGIAATGSPTDYAVDATFPVWFAIGSRVTAVEPARQTMPASFGLEQNYPNPFNPTTVIRAQWKADSWVRLVVYDMLGREVATLANGHYPAGAYTFTFDGARLASGVYFYRLTAGNYTTTKSMVLEK